MGVAKSSRAEIKEMLHRKSATYQNAAIRFMLLRLLLQSRYLPLADMNASTVLKERPSQSGRQCMCAASLRVPHVNFYLMSFFCPHFCLKDENAYCKV